MGKKSRLGILGVEWEQVSLVFAQNRIERVKIFQNNKISRTLSGTSVK